jgi:hypothetical protein
MPEPASGGYNPESEMEACFPASLSSGRGTLAVLPDVLGIESGHNFSIALILKDIVALF